MSEFIGTFLNVYAVGVLAYFVIVTVHYVVLLILSYREIRDYMHRTTWIDYKAIIQSEASAPISILAPAYNEEATIVENIHSLLSLDYPTTEVIVINDGSKDQTLQKVIQEFSLRRTYRAYFPVIPTQEIRDIYVSTRRQWDKLIVVDKVNGGKADALNVGINVARYELFCAIDADSLLEHDALLKVARPFMDNPHVVAVGGMVRIANDCMVERGQVTKVRLPRKSLPLFQIIEYLRAFLASRMGWSSLNGLLIISGAFGLFRKDIAVACGGYNHKTVGEDMELVTRMHRYMRERRAPYRMVFVPDPVCWTEAPETARVLGRQRNRWHRGLLDTLRIHSKMLFNPSFGLIGLLSMPFAVLELIGPIIEFSSYLVFPAVEIWGLMDWNAFFFFTLLAIVYGVFFSVSAVLLEEVSFRRYPKPADLTRLVLYAFLENFGYRQMTIWWRVKAFWDYGRGVKSWGAMQRTGFAQARR